MLDFVRHESIYFNTPECSVHLREFGSEYVF